MTVRFFCAASALVLASVAAAPLGAGVAHAQPEAAQDGGQAGRVRAQLEARGLERQEGFLSAYLDDASGGFLIEVPRALIGEEILAYTVTERGHEADLIPGVMDSAIIVRLEERRGGRLEVVRVDPSVRYDPDSPLSRTKDAARPKRVLGAARIVTRDGEGENEVLFVDGAALLVTASGGRIPTMQTQRNVPPPSPEVVSVGVYPDNLDAVFTTIEPERSLFRFPWQGPPEAVRIERRVSLVRLPELGERYAAREADDRVGYFEARISDPTRMGRRTTDRLIRRFALEKADPDAALSPPVEPIVFWMENTTPEAFRQPVREAVEAWNTAFEAAGFKDSIEVRQMPDDADWVPADIRYNVLRWVAKDVEFLYGAGPSVYDPRTGETLGADIYLGYSLFAGRMNTATDLDAVRTGRIAPGFDDSVPSDAMIEKVRNTVIHEVGHTLGLRHNFRASTWLDLDDFKAASAADAQLTASVMDYMPIHVARHDEDQGRYIDGTPGVYDVWAIQYGYDPALDDEDAREAFLRRSGEPGLAYASDVEAAGGYFGIDPRVQRRDATDDPIAYARHQIETSREIMAELLVMQAEKGVAEGAFRRQLSLAQSQRAGAALAAAHFVGGVYVDPLVPNAPRSGAVYTPVSAERQREALAVIDEAVFRPGAYERDIAVAPFLQDARTAFARPDIEGTALGTQRYVLQQLLDPRTLERMSDSGFYGGDYTPTRMLTDLNEIVIGDDLKGQPDPIRRNAQIAYVETLAALAEDRGIKGAVRSAAFAALRDVRGRMGLIDVLMRAEAKAHRAHVGRILDEAGV